MKLVFMGTPALAAMILEALAEHHDVVGVFTRPDAIRGRGKKLVPSPVKVAAETLGIPVHALKSLKSDEAFQLLKSLKPDVACVAAYGAILPPNILDVPKLGCLNVHTSLLPRWRGAAPIERAIMEQDEDTGVCIMRMEEGLDTGPYCIKKTISVGDKYLGELAGELANLGSVALIEALGKLESGTVTWTEQGEAGLTYASKIAKGELDFDPSEGCEHICAKVRASSDSHPSRIVLAGKRMSVERASVVEGASSEAQAGQLGQGEATFRAKRLIIGASDGMVELEQVKPEGKKSMAGTSFAAGIQGIKNKKVTWGRV